jgi:cyclophilin family peptidyl-prolyl cis-trans isomerase
MISPLKRAGLIIGFVLALLGVFFAASIVAPSASMAQEGKPHWLLELKDGTVDIELLPEVAPQHVARIVELTNAGFYNGLVWHRVIEGFMAQSGDPTGTGAGGSPLPNLIAELNGMPHLRGAVGMARAEDLNSANSQFYIMFVPRLNMDRDYTLVGRVIAGMNFVDSIERGEPPLNPSRIVRASMGADNIAAMSAEELRAAAAQMAASAQAAAPQGRATAAVGPAVPPTPPPPRTLEPVRGPQRRPPGG